MESLEYISCEQALNFPRGGNVGDWHPALYWNKENFKLYHTQDNWGISYEYIHQLEKDMYIATYPRAIYDIIVRDQSYSFIRNSLEDHLDEKDRLILYEYLKEGYLNKTIGVNFIAFRHNFITYFYPDWKNGVYKAVYPNQAERWWYD